MNATEIVDLVSSIAKKSKAGRSDREMEASIALDSARLRCELGDRVLDPEACKLAKSKLESHYKKMDLMADRISNSIVLLLLLPIFANMVLQHFNCTNLTTIVINSIFVFSFVAMYFLFLRPFFTRHRELLVAFQLSEDLKFLASETTGSDLQY